MDDSSDYIKLLATGHEYGSQDDDSSTKRTMLDVSLSKLVFCDVPSWYSPSNSPQFVNPFGGSDSSGFSIFSDPDAEVDDVNNAADSFAKYIINDVSPYIYPDSSVDTSIDNGLPNYNPADSSDPVIQTETAIIEFGAATRDSSAEPFSLDISPGDAIGGNTILGTCVQDGRQKLIKSVFSSGTVRKDTEDGGFGRLFKTVCSRHIIIDDAVRASSSDDDNVSVLSQGITRTIDASSKITTVLDSLDTSMQLSSEAYSLITEEFPYLAYPFLLYTNRKHPVYDKQDYKKSKPSVYAEDLFVDFIGAYGKIEDGITKSLNIKNGKCDIVAEIRAAQGKQSENEKIAQKFLDLRDSLFTQIDDLLEYNKYDNKAVIDSSTDCFSGDPDLYSFQKSLSTKVSSPVNPDVEFDLNSKGDKLDYYYSMLIKKADFGSSSNSDLRNEYIAVLKKIVSRRQQVYRDASFGSGNENPSWRTSFLSLLESETSEIRAFFLKCKDLYEEGNVKSCQSSYYDTDSNAGQAKNDILSSFVSSISKEYAKWPSPFPVSFGSNNYSLYTFLNDKKADDQTEDAEDLTDQDLENTTPPVPPENLDPSVSADVSVVPSVPSSEVQITDLKYWKKYCSIATAMTLGFLATGLVIAHHFIMFPCVYIPLKVINFTKAGLIIVIGIAVRGIHVDMMEILVNLDSQEETALFPLVNQLLSVKDSFFQKQGKLNITIPNTAQLLIDSLKASNTQMLKDNRRYRQELASLRSLNIPSAEDVKDYIVNNIDGQATRRMLVRRVSEAADTQFYTPLRQTVSAAFTDASSLVTKDASDFDFSTEVKEMKQNL